MNDKFIPYPNKNYTLLWQLQEEKFHLSALTESIMVPLQSIHYSCTITVHTEMNNGVTCTDYFVNGPLSSASLEITRGRLLILKITCSNEVGIKMLILFFSSALKIETVKAINKKKVLEMQRLTD